MPPRSQSLYICLGTVFYKKDFEPSSKWYTNRFDEVQLPNQLKITHITLSQRIRVTHDKDRLGMKASKMQ